MALTDTLTQKVGPLPAWGWGAVVVGGYVVFRVIRGGSLGGAGATQGPVSDQAGAGGGGGAGGGTGGGTGGGGGGVDLSALTDALTASQAALADAIASGNAANTGALSNQIADLQGALSSALGGGATTPTGGAWSTLPVTQTAQLPAYNPTFLSGLLAALNTAKSNVAKLQGYVNTYLAIPVNQRTATQNAALAKDLVTLQHDITYEQQIQNAYEVAAGLPVTMFTPAPSTMASPTPLAAPIITAPAVNLPPSITQAVSSGTSGAVPAISLSGGAIPSGIPQVVNPLTATVPYYYANLIPAVGQPNVYTGTPTAVPTVGTSATTGQPLYQVPTGVPVDPLNPGGAWTGPTVISTTPPPFTSVPDAKHG